MIGDDHKNSGPAKFLANPFTYIYSSFCVITVVKYINNFVSVLKLHNRPVRKMDYYILRP